MATYEKKNKRISIKLDGRRRYLRISKLVSGKQTQSKKRLLAKVIDWISELEIAATAGFTPDPSAVQGIRNIDWLCNSCVKLGLLAKVDVISVSDLVEDYFEFKKDCWQQATKDAWKRARFYITDLLGESTSIKSINAATADKFCSDLANASQRRSKQSKPLAKGTRSKITKRVRELFKYATKQQYIPVNPFEHIICKSSDEAKPEHLKFDVTPEIIDRVMAWMPDAEWRCALAIWYWAGARQSEPIEMKVSDIHLEGEFPTMDIYDCKESKKEKAIEVKRMGVPVFPEMASYLYDWLEVHDGQSEWLFPNLRKIDFASKFRYLRAKSGYEWPKLFNNLRVAASNRIARDYGERYLKPWLGHTVKTHTTNYKSITKADYEMVFGAPLEQRGGSQEIVGKNTSHKKSHKPLHETVRLATEYGYATPTGLEPATTGSTVRYSNQLSYRAKRVSFRDK